MKGLRIVALKEEHLPRVREIEIKSNGAAWSETAFRNELDNPHGVFLVAELGKDVVGFGGVWLMVDEAHITTLAVDPERRQGGVGRKLMDALLDQARERGMTCSTLEVRASNVAAISLYESMGYVQTTVRKRYYPDNREDAVVMWKVAL